MSDSRAPRTSLSLLIAVGLSLGPLLSVAQAELSGAADRKLRTIERKMAAVPIRGNEAAPFSKTDNPREVYQKMRPYSDALRVTRNTMQYMPADAKGHPRYAAAAAYYKRLSAKVAEWNKLSSQMQAARSKARMDGYRAKQKAKNDARDAKARERRLRTSHKVEPDDGITNETHRANVGKIVFSRKPIELAKAKPKHFTTSFALLKTKIFFRTYLGKSIKNLFLAQGFACRRGTPRRVYSMLVDDQPYDGKKGVLFVHSVKGEALAKWTSFRFNDPLNGKMNAKESSIHRRFVERVVPRLTPGSHKITLSLGGDCYGEHIDGGYKSANLEGFASGSFTLSVSKRAVAKFLRKNGPRMPKPGMRNGRMAREMKKILANKWRNEKVLKIVITSRKWDVRRNKYTGIILRRLVNAQAFVKRKGSSVCRVFDVSYEQKHLGRHRYGVTSWGGVGGNREFPCATIR